VIGLLRDRQQQAVKLKLAPEVEHSLLFRVLVQVLVSIGIIATDIASETWMSVWAVPLGLAGAAWSWRQRDRRNVATKFWLAFGMLVALGLFFARLLGALNDTRLVLAELLVQLQVLHSFDLPRRKDLGYSMMIGMVLLGVAGTLSQTSLFGIALLLFLAVALPTLVLDYRSRLGLDPQPLGWNLQSLGFSWRQFITLFLTVVVLGLTVFALLPRLPGYQIRTFPVSSTIDVEGEFNTSQISNPGYVRQGKDTNSDATGIGEGGNPGELDDEFYYGFNSQMNQNLRGRMTPKLVLRVRSQAPGFWRVLAFDRYTGQGWEVSRNQQTQTLNRSSWSYQFLLPLYQGQAKTQEVVQSYTVVSVLPNLIPTLATPRILFFPTRQVALDLEGSLRAPITLTEGVTYTVISNVPFRDRTQLQQAPDSYPELIQRIYLDVPDSLTPQLRQLAESWLSKSTSPLTNSYEKALYLTQYLKQHYQIQPELPFFDPKQDLAEAFLFQHRGGYPDHFSTVLTLMLRSIGIPARLAAGFGTGQFNPFTGFYEVQNTDAYALAEVYFPGQGWFTFDPIPGHPLYPPSVEENQTFGVLRQFWNWVAGWIPTPVSNVFSSFLGAIINWGMQLLTRFLSLFTQGWVGVLAGCMIAVVGAFMGWLSWIVWQRWLAHRRLARLAPMERLYQKMLNWLTQQGVIKQAAQTPFEFMGQLDPGYPVLTQQAIQQISEAYVGWRYGDQQPNLEDLQHQLGHLHIASAKPFRSLRTILRP
jgi:protein-glutamine gamma-glutamyltransferase